MIAFGDTIYSIINIDSRRVDIWRINPYWETLVIQKCTLMRLNYRIEQYEDISIMIEMQKTLKILKEKSHLTWESNDEIWVFQNDSLKYLLNAPKPKKLNRKLKRSIDAAAESWMKSEKKHIENKDFGSIYKDELVYDYSVDSNVRSRSESSDCRAELRQRTRSLSPERHSRNLESRRPPTKEVAFYLKDKILEPLEECIK